MPRAVGQRRYALGVIGDLPYDPWLIVFGCAYLLWNLSRL